MHRDSSSAFVVLVACIAAITLSGCARSGGVKNMREVPPDKVSVAPTADTGVIVFMRSPDGAYRVQSSVFDVTGSTTKLIGIVAANKRVAYAVKPGTYQFMVVGEAADFMSADIQAGKVYYAFVVMRMGAWKARFSLLPVHKDEMEKDTNWKDCMAECTWVELAPEAEEWAIRHSPSIEAKRKEYFAAWMEKPKTLRPRLRNEDGR